jgi:hypothetical protein
VSNPHDPGEIPRSGSLYKSSFYWIKAQFLAIFWINVEFVQSLDQIPIRLSFVGSSSIFLTIFCDELPILPCFSRGLAPDLVAPGHCLGTAFANASNLYETGPNAERERGQLCLEVTTFSTNWMGSGNFNGKSQQNQQQTRLSKIDHENTMKIPVSIFPRKPIH